MGDRMKREAKPALEGKDSSDSTILNQLSELDDISILLRTAGTLQLLKTLKKNKEAFASKHS